MLIKIAFEKCTISITITVMPADKKVSMFTALTLVIFFYVKK